MKSLGRSLFLSAALVAAGFGQGVQAAPVVFTDGTFNDADWVTTIEVDTTPDLVVTAGQVPTGGNPDEFRSITHQFTRFNTGTLHVQVSQVYNPAVQGAIESIDFSADLKRLTPDRFLVHNFVIVQNGEPYALLGGDVFNTFNDWTMVSKLNVTLADVSPRPVAFPLPDFSTSGAPIMFGYTGSAFSSATDLKTITSGLDNWRVTINRVKAPEPSTLALFLLGLLGIGLVARRRKFEL